MRTRHRNLLLARLRRHGAPLLCSALTACAGSGDGLDANGRPLDEGPGPGEPSVFSQIQDTIFTPICTQCHAGASAPLGLRLDAGNSYSQLVGVASVEEPALMRVRPGDAGNSYLVHKIEGRASSGGRMPLGGPPLSPAQIDLIRSWIAGGATRPSAVRETPFHVVSTIPAAGEAGAPTNRIQLVFNAAVDASLAGRDSVELAAGGADGGSPSNIGIARVEVSLADPTLVTITTQSPLAPGSYRLVVHGDGPHGLADVDAQALDGDGDGRGGGDFTLQFSTVAGGAP